MYDITMKDPIEVSKLRTRIRRSYGMGRISREEQEHAETLLDELRKFFSELRARKTNKVEGDDGDTE